LTNAARPVGSVKSGFLVDAHWLPVSVEVATRAPYDCSDQAVGGDEDVVDAVELPSTSRVPPDPTRVVCSLPIRFCRRTATRSGASAIPSR
jgi:hypothetical protein